MNCRREWPHGTEHVESCKFGGGAYVDRGEMQGDESGEPGDARSGSWQGPGETAGDWQGLAGDGCGLGVDGSSGWCASWVRWNSMPAMREIYEVCDTVRLFRLAVACKAKFRSLIW